METRHRWAWLAALLLAVIGGSAALVVWTLMKTDWGHAKVCALINRKVTEGIRGTLEVERIDALSFDTLTAHNVKIIAPDGVPAIVAETAVIDFSLSEMWAGRYGWSRADVRNCLVRVSQKHGSKTNMEATFEGRAPKHHEEKKEKKDSSEVDMRSMATSNCTLLIFGGSLPDLRLTDLDGIMRVHVLKNGDTELRFDHYRGSIEKGLPIGELAFHDVQGDVLTKGKRLLRFVGEGTTHKTPVTFALDVDRDGKNAVHIDAAFPEPTFRALSSAWLELWSKFNDNLDIRVQFGKEAAAQLARKLEP